MLWDALDINNFYFIFILFSDLIGLECDEAGTTDGELLPSAVLSFIDSSGAFSIYAKTCQK